MKKVETFSLSKDFFILQGTALAKNLHEFLTHFYLIYAQSKIKGL